MPTTPEPAPPPAGSAAPADRPVASRTGATSLPAGGRRSLAWLLLLYAALQAYLWFVVPTRQVVPIAAGGILLLLVMVVDPRRRGGTIDSVGLTVTHLPGALRQAALPTLALMAGLFVLSRVLPDAPDGSRFVKRFVQILPWALLQQGLLQPTFNGRLTAALGPGWRAAGLNGAAFAGMHLPNPLLTGLTFVMGGWWSRIYQKSPNLWVLVLSHALLSAAAQSLLPGAWTHGFRVGPGYFRWRG